MLIFETEVETKGWAVRVVRKYSRIERARLTTGLEELVVVQLSSVVGCTMAALLLRRLQHFYYEQQ